MTYSREGATETTRIVTGRRTANGSCEPVKRVTTGAPCLGVVLEPFVTYHFPIDVKIDTQKVGGPSAGLAFTLAIIDDLTPGDLTGGRRVAVTGTINPDGTVGPVGGVEQKAITARHNDVSMMIVPKQEVKDARAGRGQGEGRRRRHHRRRAGRAADGGRSGCAASVGGGGAIMRG